MQLRRLLFCVVVVPVVAFAQSSSVPPAATATSLTEAAPGQRTTLPPAPPAPDAAELTSLLKDFLAGASRNDPAMHERFWAPDLIYTGSVGRRIGKADILREVHAEGVPKPGAEATTYTAEDIRIQQYGTTAVVAFRLVATTTKAEKTEVANYFNSGTFLKRDGQWQAVNWQATKIPAEKEKKN